MADKKPAFQVIFDYSDVPTLKKFALCDDRVRCIIGPFGCIRGDVKVVTEEGLLPISSINRPMRVLSWNEKNNQFELSLSGGAFPKGKGYLYRIVTQQGEFVAAGHHRVFCGDHKYRRVADLHLGDSLIRCSSDHLLKSASEVPLSSHANDPHFLQIISSWMGHYAELARQYGQQLLKEANIFPTYIPLRDDVPKLSSYLYSDVYEQMGDYSGRLREHIRPSQLYDHSCTCDSSGHFEPRNEDVQDHYFLQFFSHISGLIPKRLQSPLNTFYHRIKQLFSQYFRSLSTSSLSEWPILSIEKLKVKEVYWDLQVLDTNNYVTADGTIHHNSGKSSACVMEIIRRAHEMPPGPDGIRRSRWAVVRNSYNQLSDTTIKTFHDWFPPKLFGEWRVTDHKYIITKFPGVHLEILFRALDRPDQVSNLLSLELTGAWFNEVREIPWAIVEAMDGRIFRYPSKRDVGKDYWSGMIMDTNPPEDDSRMYKVFEVVRPKGYTIFKQPSGLSSHAENTTHLAKNYYKNLANGKDEMYIRVYIHGQYGYVISGKPVFQSFVDNVHVAPHPLEPIKGLDIIAGFDFGLQPACTLGQVTPYGQLRILDELVSDGMGLRQFCENQLLPLLRRKYFGYNIVGYGDPSGTSRAPTDESTCFEVLQGPDIGLRNILPAPTNAILPRISAVEGFLNKMWKGEPGFLLSPNCRYLRKAMNGGYHYDKDPKSSGDEYKPMPVKNFSSHISDSCQMLCMYITEKQLNDQRWKNVEAQMAKSRYQPACSEIGY